VTNVHQYYTIPNDSNESNDFIDYLNQSSWYDLYFTYSVKKILILGSFNNLFEIKKRIDRYTV